MGGRNKTGPMCLATKHVHFGRPPPCGHFPILIESASAAVTLHTRTVPTHPKQLGTTCKSLRALDSPTSPKTAQASLAVTQAADAAAVNGIIICTGASDAAQGTVYSAVCSPRSVTACNTRHTHPPRHRRVPLPALCRTGPARPWTNGPVVSPRPNLLHGPQAARSYLGH